MPYLRVENLQKRFRAPDGSPIDALRDVSFSVDEGERFALLGPSASGKTTLLRLIAGLEKPDHGEIFIGEKTMTGPPEERDVAMVFQNLALLPHLTAGENMALPLRLRKRSKSEIRDSVLTMAETLGITACLNRLPGQLSGGEQQRVALGRCLVRRPKLLLLDEPLTGLDLPSRLEMRALLSSLDVRFGCTLVYVTHDQNDALSLGNRLGILASGRIEQIATAAEIYHRPATVFVAGFVGSPPINFLRGTLSNHGVGVFFQPETRSSEDASSLLPLPESRAAPARVFLGKSVILGVRPEAVRMVQPLNGEGIAARIEWIEFLGPNQLFTCSSAVGNIGVSLGTETDFRLHDRVRLVFDRPGVHLFNPETKRAIL